MNLGGNAPGIVFERLIYGLTLKNTIDVYTAKNDASLEFAESCKVFSVKYFDLHPRLKRLLINFLSFNPLDLLWAASVNKIIKKRNEKYDVVFSFISMNHYAALEAGRRLQRNNGLWAIYSVDAIPSPEGWYKQKWHNDRVKCLVKRNFSKADAFFSANEKMLEFEKSLFTNTKNCLFDVIYNPTQTKLSHFKKTSNYNFLYTGGIYGARKVSYLLKALKLLLLNYPTVELHFVGTVLSDNDLNILDENERKAVFIHPRVDDLSIYYKNSFALIDIDADLENDIFLSSKVINYLTVNRPIICETGTHSPSRQIFSNINSIIQCNHDHIELFEAMKYLIEFPVENFDDRNEVIKMFEINEIATKIMKNLTLLQHDNNSL